MDFFNSCTIILRTVILHSIFLLVRLLHLHQHFHLLDLNPSAMSVPYCKKWCLGICGIAVFKLTQDIDSHHRGRVLVQLKNKCAAPSSIFLHNGQSMSYLSYLLTCVYILDLGPRSTKLEKRKTP